MSLATRCPSCGTVFRVVQDQLRVSEGWVRCGRCNGVFNAAEVLFDIDSGASVVVDLGLPETASSAPPANATASTAASTAASDPARWAGDRQDPRFDTDRAWPHAAHAAHADHADHAEQPLLRAPSRDQDDLVDEIVITDHVPSARPAADPLSHTTRHTTPHSPPDSTPHAADHPAQAAAQPPALLDEPAARVDFSAAAAAAASAAATASAAQALPSFLRTAERNALWRRPAMRAAAAVGVVVLALALGLQAALLWRDTLAARWPASTPALAALCRLAGCSVQPLRRIESLAVHSSGLNRLEGSTLYRLQIVLQNRADTALAMPAIELTLNDAQGQLVARRVLQAAELGVPQALLQAGEELPIKALLSTGERRIDGYTLELFYP